MKNLFKFGSFVLLLTVLSACKKEPALIGALTGDLITCFKGGHTCIGIEDVPYSHSAIQGKFTFKEGTNYQEYWSQPNSQVNKLFGATDCGNYIPSRENSAMVGFRHLPGTDLIELLGYVHREDAYRNGVNFRHANIAVIPRNQAVDLKISVTNSWYRFSANGNRETLMKRHCSDSTFKGRKIGTWFGGQLKAPVKVQIGHKKIVGVVSQFPKHLNLMDEDKLCQKGLDPIDYLVKHESGIYTAFKNECAGKLEVQALGCDANIETDRYSGTSDNSDAGFRYLVTCQR